LAGVSPRALPIGDAIADNAGMESLREELSRRFAAREPCRDAPEDVPRAAVVLLVAPSERGRPQILLIERARRDGDPWSGHMALPGGRVDAEDRDWLETALRETREEVGVALERAHLVGELDDLRPVTAPARIVVRPFVFVVPTLPRIDLCDREVAGAHWEELSRLASSRGSVEVVHLGSPRVMPCYFIGGRAVWGMTHRILEPFLEMASELER